MATAPKEDHSCVPSGQWTKSSMMPLCERCWEMLAKTSCSSWEMGKSWIVISVWRRKKNWECEKWFRCSVGKYLPLLLMLLVREWWQSASLFPCSKVELCCKGCVSSVVGWEVLVASPLTWSLMICHACSRFFLSACISFSLVWMIWHM